MKRNIKDLPDVIEIGKKLGADMFSISNVLPYTKEMRGQTLYEENSIFLGTHASESTPQLLLPRMKLNDITQNPIIQAIKKSGPITISRQEISVGEDTCPFIEKGSLSFRWDGMVSPRQALLHENENFLDFRKRKTLTHFFGNINNSSLQDIWNEPEYVAFRKRVIGFDFSYCTRCNACNLAGSNLEDCFGSPAPTCGACLWAQGLIQCP